MTTDRDLLVDLAAGNPGALTALMALYARDDAAETISVLVRRDITGPEIWVGYKDHCEQDAAAFAEQLKAGDDALFATIEAYRDLRGGSDE